jgi:hypothetical protein
MGAPLHVNAPRSSDERAARDAADPHGEDFRLISIGATRAPSGCAGRDWLIYRIAQGDNIITGYRRGDLATASADVETIVAALNGRRRSTKPKPGPKPGRRPANVVRARAGSDAD